MTLKGGKLKREKNQFVVLNKPYAIFINVDKLFVFLFPPKWPWAFLWI